MKILKVIFVLVTFRTLPFSDQSFDFVIDRGSLTLAPRQDAIDCVREIDA